MKSVEHVPGDDALQRSLVLSLRDRHAWLRAVVRRAVDAHDPARRMELAHAIRHHWQAHAGAAEQCVYRPLQDHVEAEQQVIAGRTDHAEIGRLVGRLFEENPCSMRWHEVARQLSYALEHHVHSEELALLPRLGSLMDARQSSQLGVLYEQLCTQGLLCVGREPQA